LLLAIVPAFAQTGPVALKSPDGSLEISIATLKGDTLEAAGGHLAYRIAYRGKPVFQWSGLGLSVQGGPPLGADMRVTGSQPSGGDETWTAVHGKANPIRNHYNAVTVEAVETGRPNRKLTIEARAYDDGVAFRYLIPAQPMMRELRISAEDTQFIPAKDAATFPLILNGYRSSHEDDYHELAVSAIHPDYLVGLPLLMEVPGVAWVGLTEANIDNWAGMYLGAPRRGRGLEARLAPRIDEPGLAVSTATPARSPWRVFMIAAEPGRLIESNLVVNLNPPCALADTSWIKPGKTSWDWWSGSVARNVSFEPGMNTATMKHYIDFSARSGFDYMLVDAGWAKPGGGPNDSGSDITRTTGAIDMPELLSYAKSKNVRLWLWAHWTDVDRQMDEAFPLFEKWGIAGVKIDFMDRDDQWMVNWFRRVAQKAAEHKLMLDYHGAFKPDGLRRTYPNVMTREGVMGLEYTKWSARITPKHNVAVAFTRMLAGPLDYTPGGFENVTRAAFEPRGRFPMVQGTRAHETALYAIFESPFQMAADDPGAYEGQKEFEFIRAVPTVWDETRVLNGVPVKYVTIARRHGKEWYVGSITDWDARELDVPLSFLGAGSYTATVFADGADAATEPKHATREEKRVDAKTVLKLKLAPGGGAAIRIVPAN
ncbi:MAG TPA: glycoside hydrolase family 97 protein, partial [Bryobacteraceae bacterium]|nr:glycoside hydrolase family 97 protein [Bryobacteraceae bacterium]